ncbi:MAG: tyrosine-type recombinase/integrase [Flavobacterium sp.]|nr:tyrosine-type recombinase/integrase [Flavobacterium sp.]
MATIKFLLQSSSESAQIYVRLSISRQVSFKKKTGFTINPNDWSITTSKPKQNNPENKRLSSNLKKLDAYIDTQYNDAIGNGIVIDTQWLQSKIDECFNRVQVSDQSLLVNHIQHIIDNANTRKIQGRRKLGISDSRIKSYQRFKGIIEEFQFAIKRQISFEHINKPFVDRFTNWLINTRCYAINYAGKQVDNLKTVCLDAEKLGISSNPYFKQIETFSESDDDRYIITLSQEELEKIREADLQRPALINARKWMLIGCEIGQRVGDLLKISHSNLRHKGQQVYLDIKQEKTKKSITIPVTDRIASLVENDLPYSISGQKLNQLIKQVCQAAGIDTLTEGKKLDPETKRKILGLYPKYQLATTHSFRRSYATNYYRHIPTSILMKITGHSKESTFLQYINQREDMDNNADLFMDFYARYNAPKEPQLKVVKDGTYNH